MDQVVFDILEDVRNGTHPETVGPAGIGNYRAVWIKPLPWLSARREEDLDGGRPMPTKLLSRALMAAIAQSPSVHRVFPARTGRGRVFVVVLADG